MSGLTMHCLKHAAAAIGVCAYCGRALCRDCVPSPTVGRLVCSTECDQSLARNARVIQSLLDRTSQSARASAFYCYLTSGWSAVAAVAAWFMLPSPFLIGFTAACALVLFAAGFWYQRVARKHGLDA